MIRLKVPYFKQIDNPWGQGARMCYSSSNSMVLEFFKPGALKHPTLDGDDVYLTRVNQFGDTTQAFAQVAALKSYGLEAVFTQKATLKTIEDRLKAGKPTSTGILILGHADRPYGGGHWIVVIGETEDRKSFICHDPYGELDMVNGGYPRGATGGEGVIYSKTNFAKRFLDRTGHGWAVLAEPPKGQIAKEHKAEVKAQALQIVKNVTPIKIDFCGQPMQGLRVNGETHPPIETLKEHYAYQYIKEIDTTKIWEKPAPKKE